VLRSAGILLVALGGLILLFVAFQLWGTGILEAQHQAVLRRRFETELQQVHTQSKPRPARDPVQLGPIKEGQPIGILDIPKISLNVVVVDGTSPSDLTLGPGLYFGSPMPGDKGNAAIAGHRTTFGAPFFNLNELRPGDDIYITTLQGHFRFVVTGSLVVSPNDVAVVAPTSFPELTLTTCDPPFSAADRLVVHALLKGRFAPLLIAGPGGSRAVRTRVQVTEGLAGATSGWENTLGWGLGLAALTLAVWFFARRRRRHWLVYLASVPLFVVPLFFFFEGINGLIPGSY
jgi:sortase A